MVYSKSWSVPVFAPVFAILFHRVNVDRIGDIGALPSNILLKALEERIAFEVTNFLKPRTKDVEMLTKKSGDLKPTGLLLYFIYDSVLRLIGSNSGYINALGLAGLFVNVIYSVSAYLYFAILVGIIVKWAKNNAPS